MNIEPCTIIELNGEYHIVDQTIQRFEGMNSVRTYPLKEYLMDYRLVSIDGGKPTTIKKYLEELIPAIVSENPIIYRNKK